MYFDLISQQKNAPAQRKSRQIPTTMRHTRGSYQIIMPSVGLYIMAFSMSY